MKLSYNGTIEYWLIIHHFTNLFQFLFHFLHRNFIWRLLIQATAYLNLWRYFYIFRSVLYKNFIEMFYVRGALVVEEATVSILLSNKVNLRVMSFLTSLITTVKFYLLTSYFTFKMYDLLIKYYLLFVPFVKYLKHSNVIACIVNKAVVW